MGRLEREGDEAEVECAGLDVQVDAGGRRRVRYHALASGTHSDLSSKPPCLCTGCLLLLTGPFPPLFTPVTLFAILHSAQESSLSGDLP